MNVNQGDVVMVYIGKDIMGCEQQMSNRPVIVVQNDCGNRYSHTTIICPLTKKNKTYLPTHYILHKCDYPFLTYDSLILGEQIRCIDAGRICKKLGRVSNTDIQYIIEALQQNF